MPKYYKDLAECPLSYLRGDIETAMPIAVPGDATARISRLTSLSAYMRRGYSSALATRAFVGSQPIYSGVRTQVFFPDQEFDLNDEYDPVLGFFTPEEDGSYIVSSNVLMEPFLVRDNRYFQIEISEITPFINPIAFERTYYTGDYISSQMYISASITSFLALTGGKSYGITVFTDALESPQFVKGYGIGVWSFVTFTRLF